MWSFLGLHKKPPMHGEESVRLTLIEGHDEAFNKDTSGWYPRRVRSHNGRGAFNGVGIVVLFALIVVIGSVYVANDAVRQKNALLQQLDDTTALFLELSNKTVPLQEPNDDTTVLHSYIEPPNPLRESDITDTFANYKYRNECAISSLDLHLPFSPLCPDRASVLEAMSNGGRPGYDTPYIPRGCDMRWYSSEETCEILSRFQKIYILGDSFMRHIVVAIWVIIRGDLGYGGMGTLGNNMECRCENQIHDHPCSNTFYWDSGKAFQEVGKEMICEPGSFDLQYRIGLEWPLKQETLDKFTELIPRVKPEKPLALVLDHSLHNDANITKTTWYIDQLIGQWNKSIPWFQNDDSHLYLPRLYVSSSASNWLKPLYPNQQMNPIARFERAVKPIVEERGLEFLGAYNMTVQDSSYDGTHSTFRANLVKAQMILNWLDKLEQPGGQTEGENADDDNDKSKN